MESLFKLASGFQYSVNIGYDINNDDKLKGFIPTKAALDLLKEILLSTEESSTERARVLIGAYGKGKSHIVLMILSLLMKKDLSLFSKMIPKIKEDPQLYKLVKDYYSSTNKILPIVITGNSTSPSQAFILSLQRALSDNDLLDIMPDTNYKAALSTIERWEEDYPDTYNSFIDRISIPIEKYKNELELFNRKIYEDFEKVYPTLTAGSVFNPFLGFDVVDLYEEVATKIKSHGYSGIYLVYDEFSKYLEANITNTSADDVEMLQKFAEKCNRSGSLQMHVMLITHKEISNYIDKLPNKKVDGWRGVSERYKHLHLSNNFSQTYEIISAVINKNEKAWNSFFGKHEKEFNELDFRYTDHPAFKGLSGEVNGIVTGCYPLHPISTFVLPRLSEKVAQNERTLFTFLSATGDSTLSSFIAANSIDRFNLITPDLIYDYFEPLFKKELYDGDLYKNYVLTTSILSRLSADSVESKIIKTISLIYMLEQFECLKPTKEEIIGIYAFEYGVDSISAAIDCLIDKDLVVYLKRSNNFLMLKRTSGVDIKQTIKNALESKQYDIDAKSVLNSSNFDMYMYPTRYNDTREMIRYFAFKFIDSNELNEDTNWTLKICDTDADGSVIGIVRHENDDFNEITRTLIRTSKNIKNCIFVIPNNYREIDSIAKEHYVVTKLKEAVVDDQVLYEEYNAITDDLGVVISDYIYDFTHPERCEVTYIYNGNKVGIRRKAALTELMSQICDELFSMTPVIVNEAVNKQDITTTTFNSRNKIVSALLRTELEHNLGFSGTGQETSIMRSTLVRTGILIDDEGGVRIDLKPNNESICYMLSVIVDFIEEAKKSDGLSFGELYHRLMSSEYKLGLRKGLIPIYIAAVIHCYKHQIIVVDQFGPTSVNSDLISEINAKPNDYRLEYLCWDADKEEYINRLSCIFSDYLVEEDKNNNPYEYVAKAMTRWYMALPRYSKDCKSHPDGRKITERQLALIKLLRQNISASDLLFKSIPSAFKYSEGPYADVGEEIAETKSTFDGLLKELKDQAINSTKEIFALGETPSKMRRMSLSSLIVDWREGLDSTIDEQLFQNGTDRFLEQVQGLSNDEYEVVSRIAKLSTDLRMEDWDQKTILSYLEKIKLFKETADNYHNDSVLNKSSSDTSSYLLAFADNDGNVSNKRFDRVEISPRGKLLYNQVKSAVDSMGQSISDQEKRQIIIEILRNLC